MPRTSHGCAPQPRASRGGTRFCRRSGGTVDIRGLWPFGFSFGHLDDVAGGDDGREKLRSLHTSCLLGTRQD